METTFDLVRLTRAKKACDVCPNTIRAYHCHRESNLERSKAAYRRNPQKGIDRELARRKADPAAFREERRLGRLRKKDRGQELMQLNVPETIPTT